jgi:hypothetical protein
MKTSIFCTYVERYIMYIIRRVAMGGQIYGKER